MKLLHNLSIKNKLIFIILAVTLLTSSAGFTIIIFNEYRSMKDELNSNSIMQAKLVGEYSISPLVFQDKEGLEEILQKTESINSVLSCTIFDENGNLAAAYNKMENEPVEDTIDAETAVAFTDGLLQINQPILYNGIEIGSINLIVSTAHLEAKITGFILTLLLLLFGLFAAAYLLASRLQKIVSKPIFELVKVTKNISESLDYTTRVKKRSNDEIGDLYDSFNNMIEQVQIRQEEKDKAEKNLKEYSENLEEIVEKRTVELKKTINLMAGREIRMMELKKVIEELHLQIKKAGLIPEADDPLKM